MYFDGIVETSCEDFSCSLDTRTLFDAPSIFVQPILCQIQIELHKTDGFATVSPGLSPGYAQITHVPVLVVACALPSKFSYDYHHAA